MAELGKSLVFYLRYFDEMQALYEKDGTAPDLTDFDPVELDRKVTTVGQQAGREATDLLERCFEPLRNRLGESTVISLGLCRRTTLERNWSLTVDLLPRNAWKKSAAPTRQFGLELDRSGIHPWLWSRGGRLSEDRIKRMISPLRCRGSKELGWTGGSVVFGPFPIPWASAPDFIVDAEPIVSAVHQLLDSFTTEFFEHFVTEEGGN